HDPRRLLDDLRRVRRLGDRAHGVAVVLVRGHARTGDAVEEVALDRAESVDELEDGRDRPGDAVLGQPGPADDLLDRPGERQRVRPDVEEAPGQRRQPGVAGQQAAVLPCQGAQLLAPVGVVLRAGQREFAEGRVQGEFEQVVLGVDVPVDGHRRHVQFGGQAAHGEPRQALGVQQPDGDLGDPLPVQPGGLSPAAPAPARLPARQPDTGARRSPGPLGCPRHGTPSSTCRFPHARRWRPAHLRVAPPRAARPTSFATPRHPGRRAGAPAPMATSGPVVFRTSRRRADVRLHGAGEDSAPSADSDRSAGSDGSADSDRSADSNRSADSVRSACCAGSTRSACSARSARSARRSSAAASSPPASTATAPASWLVSRPEANASVTRPRSPGESAAASAAGRELAATGTSAAKHALSTAPSTATPSPLPNSASVPLIPAPTPAFSRGMELMMACAIAGLAIAQPTPMRTRPSSVPAYPCPVRVAMEASPAAITTMPRAIESGVPRRPAHFADRPVKLRATTVRASGAVRSPASRGP